MYALVDCNNFYASCERLFRPDLRNKAIVVLSNNDGCVIARSNEAKELGIQMAVPFFQIKALCRQYKIAVFSSNYTLYGDLSRRVMTVLEDSWPEVEIYSIDEAFLDLTSLPAVERESFCAALQKKVTKHTGIPVSIGMGATKTLAKLANLIAKKELKIPTFYIDKHLYWLSRIAVGDVWGIGRQWDKKLLQQGIYTAQDLADLNLQHIKGRFNKVLMATVMELKGIACNGLQEPEHRKSILSSKSFGRMQTEYSIMAQAISSHCARACEKLRQQGLVTQYLSVFIRTNRFRQDLPQYHQSIGFKLITPSDDLRYLTRCAKLCLRKIFREGFSYHKVGISFADLSSKEQLQLDLFNQPTAEQAIKTERFMAVLEAVNNKYGAHVLRLAAEGHIKPWAMRHDMRSPCYTTQWADLRVVNTS